MRRTGIRFPFHRLSQFVQSRPAHRNGIDEQGEFSAESYNSFREA